MKRISIILMAFALVLTMAQCKKNEETNQDEIVTISLDVKYNNGSKVDVNTMIGTVNFETGDRVYVGSGGKYVGFLTHNGTNFVGNITNPTEGQPLQFYFLGNVTPNETLTAGTTEGCSVIISDQTEHLPVISCAASNENYVSGLTSYTGHLLNKCALVKFNVTTPSNSPICITGMHNKVTVDFSENTVTPSMDGEGIIKLPAGAGENVEKWAILLPQEAMEEGEEGSAYSEDGSYTGIRPTMSKISENDYLANGIDVTVNTVPVAVVPEGAINGLFTINANGDQVYFSKGNLQYQASTNTWRFAENQWNYVGGAIDVYQGNVYENGVLCDNALASSTYGGWIDLFGWGTSGYHDSGDLYNVNYEPWATSTNTSNPTYNFYGYGPSTNMDSPDLTDSSANYDWGIYNSIINGGNIVNYWHTLSKAEWNYVFNTRTTISGIRYAKAQTNGVNGIVLFPDDWDANTYTFYTTNMENAVFGNNILTASEWATVENAGAVFLPAAGIRVQNSPSSCGFAGGYSSTSCYSNSYAYYMGFGESDLETSYCGRYIGLSVRLVCPAQ